MKRNKTTQPSQGLLVKTHIKAGGGIGNDYL